MAAQSHNKPRSSNKLHSGPLRMFFLSLVCIAQCSSDAQAVLNASRPLHPCSDAGAGPSTENASGNAATQDDNKAAPAAAGQRGSAAIASKQQVPLILPERLVRHKVNLAWAAGSSCSLAVHHFTSSTVAKQQCPILSHCNYTVRRIGLMT